MTPDARVLSPLIDRLRAVAGDYRRAGADGPGLSDAFGAAASAHDRTAQELEAVLHAAGGAASGVAPPAAPTGLARAAGEGAAAVAQAVERVEADLLAAFRAAADGAVSGPVRDAIVRASDALGAGRHLALQRLDALDG